MMGTSRPARAGKQSKKRSAEDRWLRIGGTPVVVKFAVRSRKVAGGPAAGDVNGSRVIGACGIDMLVALDDHRPQETITWPAPPKERSADDLLRIETLGHVRIRRGDDDLTMSVMRRPMGRFILLYLIALEGLEPGQLIMRSCLAEEVFPGVAPEVRVRRLRHHLSELSGLAPIIGKLIRRDSVHVGLDTSCAEVDLVELLELGRQLQTNREPMSPAMIEHVRRMLSLARRGFIPDWDEIEDRCSGGGGVASDIVARVRARVDDVRVTMLNRLAETYVARTQPARAFPLLREAVEYSRDQEEAAQRLAMAYEAAHQHRRAARVREEYGIGVC